MATIIVGTNSYVTEAELVTYAADRGVVLNGTPSVLLIIAMDYLESLEYKGVKTDPEQALQWPRKYVAITNYNGCSCADAYIDSTTVPQDIKNAQMALAMQIDEGNNPLATSTQQVKSETVGPLSVTYMDGSTSVPYLKTVRVLINKYLLNGSGGFNNATVRKA